MEHYRITPERFPIKKFLLFWLLANIISISFIVILSGTVQYYFPGLMPIGFGMYADTQLFFMSWGIALFTLINIIFAYYYFKKKHPKSRKKRR